MYELKEKSSEELEKLLLDFARERFNLLIQKSSDDSSLKSHLFKNVKRNIARVKTILHARNKIKE